LAPLNQPRKSPSLCLFEGKALYVFGGLQLKNKNKEEDEQKKKEE